jgi:hypothetical protein
VASACAYLLSRSEPVEEIGTEAHAEAEIEDKLVIERLVF